MTTTTKISTHEQDDMQWTGYVDGLWVEYGVPESEQGQVLQHPHTDWPVCEVIDCYDESGEYHELTDEQVKAVREAWTERAPNIR